MPPDTLLRPDCRIVIGGVGLIGGSLGLRLKSLSPSPHVVAFGRSESTLTRAKARGAIDEYFLDPAAAVRGADLVLLASPVLTIPDLMERIGPHLPSRAVVTDAGSSKAWITAEASKRLPAGIRFVGSHPMAGSEKSGIDHATAVLFEQAVVVMTPSPSSDEESMLLVRELWEKTGALVLTLSPEIHDRVVASISHLPHITAAALVNAVANRAERDPRTLQLAAGGFRDTTRIASSQAEMWRDICLSNRDAILSAIEEMRVELFAFKEALERGDATTITNFFTRARTEREKVPPKGSGLLPSIIDLFVELPDRPGSIAEVTGILGRSGINIVDIEIARLRESASDAPLRLFFHSNEDRDAAAQALSAAGYEVAEPK